MWVRKPWVGEKRTLGALLSSHIQKFTEEDRALIREELDEIDRNARAYGFEIGRGQRLSEGIETSEDNPFLDPNWRDTIEESK